LRRYAHAGSDNTPERARYEASVLQLVEKAGVAAPRLLWLDAGGEAFGVPALCLTYIGGATRYEPRNRVTWTADLAKAAAQIHSVTTDRYDLNALEPLGASEILADLLSKEHIELVRERDDPLLREVYNVLLEELDNIRWLEPCLIHNDFWPGNTVFNRGRLAAVIDWGDAKLGDPRRDVAHCETEIAFTLDLETGLMFREAYERIAGPLSDLWYFHLYSGFISLLWVDHWLVSYAEAGMDPHPQELHASCGSLSNARWNGRGNQRPPLRCTSSLRRLVP
jgi:aminoglycoside phosphotransferase (APT) family kinase protein